MVAFDREGPVGESLAPVVDKLLVETQRATRLADVVARRLRAPGNMDITIRKWELFKKHRKTSMRGKVRRKEAKSGNRTCRGFRWCVSARGPAAAPWT